jgi:RHH-type proline utilization regulon transcriptional repressor/proline dehydrogenase/delta 1-pyrroline-5-carboxylate dehydrogenase
VTLADFANEPLLELRRGATRDPLTAALAELDGQLPLAVPITIAGDHGSAGGLDSTDPGSPGRLVARAGRATAADAAAAVTAAEEGFRDWSARPAAERAATLVAAADTLRARRHELAALVLRECAKPWAEADADVCEAIDFLEYYARAAVELDRGSPLAQVPGEHNALRHAPRGVCAVIAPWNFPLAIPAGMTAAALAVGNAVVLKPAEQSPACGHALVAALHGAGVPPAALGLVPGEGDAGAALVADPRVHAIAFTGSAAVGLEIVRAAAEPREGQRHVKRVVAEMGGKNCAIVDADADLDEVVPAIVGSAFGYAGQKCSACSRVLAHEAIAAQLHERLAGATEILRVGQADDFATDVPPLIERSAQERVERYVRECGDAVTRATAGPADGWFAAPALATGLDPDAPVLREEVFGPLLTLEAVRSIDDACDRVDALPFALTGGVFSRSPAAIAAVSRRTPVGNLYVNRAITGAMVARQPFGGNRLSGTGTKAGGPGYVEQFTEARVVTENTMRHGIPVD